METIPKLFENRTHNLEFYAQKRDAAFEKRCALARAHKVRVLGEEEYKYFKSWKNQLLREIAPHMPGAKPLEMAKACRPAITAAEVSETLDFLLRAKLLKKDAKGNFLQTEKAVSIGDVDAVPIAVRDLQRQMGELAIKSLSFPQSERDMSGLTMGITRRSYERIKQELADCRRRIMAIVTEDDDTEQVYRLNMQLFPISECLEQKEKVTPKKRKRS